MTCFAGIDYATTFVARVAYYHRRLSPTRSFAEGGSLPGFPEGLAGVAVVVVNGLPGDGAGAGRACEMEIFQFSRRCPEPGSRWRLAAGGSAFKLRRCGGLPGVITEGIPRPWSGWLFETARHGCPSRRRVEA